MAYRTTNQTAPFGAETTFHAINAIENARISVVNWSAKRSTMKKLQKLSPELQADIGVHYTKHDAVTEFNATKYAY